MGIVLAACADGGQSSRDDIEGAPDPAPPEQDMVVDSAAGELTPAAVLRAYYNAIDSRDYRTAYNLWANGGAASGQSFEEFAAGFSETRRVRVEVGEPGRVEGAAGSQYVEIPVVVHGERHAGDRERFEGSYTLRRSMVEGATRAQAVWHIYSASIVQSEPQD